MQRSVEGQKNHERFKTACLDSELMILPFVFHAFAGYSQLEARGVFGHDC